ncbi:hypothetical protein [Clostridium felsineum]|uniref:Uncharacterized protein n=1 Tax=Clostridium felsineum TaxID=36839 RepID=A0A1S8KZT4_9CLOT|nr:hypothetical protein [Clostridium felsineum]URZ06471.1 hypothetical protein CLROS_018040 [Clostridium felsineum]URZ11506.1 hypothetical protein CROST_022230 [Clostridium felsineum]
MIFDIQILKINYDVDWQDVYNENFKQREFRLSGYKIEYFLNKYIRTKSSRIKRKLYKRIWNIWMNI